MSLFKATILTLLLTAVGVNAVDPRTKPQPKVRTTIQGKRQPSKPTPSVPVKETQKQPEKEQTETVTKQEIPKTETPVTPPPLKEEPIIDSTPKESFFDSLANKAKTTLQLTKDNNMRFYLATANFVEEKTASIWGYLKERPEIGAVLFAVLMTLLVLKCVNFIFGRKESKTQDNALNTAIFESHSKTIVSQVTTLKTDIDKTLQLLTAKIGDLQKSIEKMATEKRDEEPLEFLFGNLGDLWKEIRDLKTRVNEADAVGSNLISFNSKMDLRNLDRKDRGGIDDQDDDSTSRKGVNAEITSRILPKDILTQNSNARDEPVRQPPGIESDPESKLESAKKTLLKGRTEESETKLNKQKELPSQSTKGPIRPNAMLVPPSVSMPAPVQSASEPVAPKEEEQTKQTDFEPIQTEADLTNTGTGAPILEQPETIAEQPKLIPVPQRLPLPTNLIPKTQAKKPQMIRAVPPRAPTGAPMPRPGGDSNNLI